ncbi:MAG TPA: M15 family metallopeptidase [Fimbriimonadaceae bacterium]|nr:M15 family metallopeptidase [Fimbriimonadaceae bacterium]
MKKISPAEPVTDLKKVKIVECGEPLVDYLDLCPDLVKASPVFDYHYEHVVRETVAGMLCRAAKALPKGYRLGVLEGWRPHHIQRRMYQRTWNRFKEQHPDWSDIKLRRVANRYTAPLNDRVPPPHSTGGAVDLFLLDDALNELDMRSPFERFDRRAFHTDAKGLSPKAQEHRRIFASALREGGLTNYPSEFWHWSHGDQGWAYRTGADNAIYGVTEPPEYEPDPRDLTDEPVVWVAST